MKSSTRLSIVGVVVGALGLAACSGGNDAAESTDPPASSEAPTGSSSGSTASGADLSGESITYWTTEDNADRVLAMQAIIDGFTAESGIEVELVALAEDQLDAQITASAAADDLPDVFGTVSLGTVHSLAVDEFADVQAAADVIAALGADTFSPQALELVSIDGNPVAVPSDAWAGLIIYRKDLFEAAGLAVPDNYDSLLAAAEALNKGAMAGIVAPTKAGDSFTQQSFEFLAQGNGCEATDATGVVTLNSPECVEAFEFYTDLIQKGSVTGGQDADTTRAAYFAGNAAMIIWSSFILDEMAGLRDDALPTCAECAADPLFLAENSGVVTAVQGPQGEPTQYGEIVSFVITDGGNTDPAKAFVEYMMSTGYADWLELAPEGKFPTRLGNADDAAAYTTAWAGLEAGVDRKAKLSAVYPAETIDALSTATELMSRWGFANGQGSIVGPMLVELPVANALAAALDGSSNPQDAADNAQADVEEILESLG